MVLAGCAQVELILSCLKHHLIKAYRGNGVKFRSFLTLAVELHASAALPTLDTHCIGYWTSTPAVLDAVKEHGTCQD